MKVLLLTTNTLDSTCLPLGLYSLIAYFQKKYPEIDVNFDVQYFQRFSMLKILKYIASEKPDVVGLGCFIWNIRNMLFLCKKLRSLYPEMRLVLGGSQISFADEELKTLVFEGEIDYLIYGEGEYTFSELMFHLKNRSWVDIEKIPGLMGKDLHGQIFANARPKEYQVNLDELPNLYLTFPELREATRENKQAVYLETSRGCPYQCAYCVASTSDFICKNVDNVIRELQGLEELGFKDICILDGTLNFNRTRTKTLLQRIIALDLGMRFEFELKVELLDDELIYLLKAAGMGMMEIGLQSSNEATLKTINRYHDRQKFTTNISKLLQNGFKMVVDIIIGLPGEMIEDWYNSLDFCYSCGDIEIAGIVLKLLPNTPLYRDKEKYGYTYNSQAMNRIINSNTMTAEMVDQAERMAQMMHSIWSNPGNQELRPYIRGLCDKYYENKFSQFLKDLTDYIHENGVASQVMGLSLEKTRMLIDYFIEARFSGGNKCHADN